MNLRFKTSLLEHMKSVGAWARASGAHCSVDPSSLVLDVQAGTARFALQPQFVGKRDGVQLSYFSIADQHAAGFVGWFAHPLQSWDLSTSKLIFKERARELGIPTPRHWSTAAQAQAPFLIKRSRSSFGQGILGPFAVGDAKALQYTMVEGDYIDEFKTGRIARAWYWCGRLAVLELFDMPAVRGDGHSSFAQLLAKALNGGLADLPKDFNTMAAWQRINPALIVPAGKKLLLDYRYVSPFNPTIYGNYNRFAELKSSPIAQAFVQAGHRLWPQILIHDTTQAAFVLDAIVDDKDQAWFLEINSNAQLHPDIYPVMLSSLVREMTASDRMAINPPIRTRSLAWSSPQQGFVGTAVSGTPLA
jgi:hypothetical protein